MLNSEEKHTGDFIETQNLLFFSPPGASLVLHHVYIDKQDKIISIKLSHLGSKPYFVCLNDIDIGNEYETDHGFFNTLF